MFGLRKLQAMVLGVDLDQHVLRDQLRASAVPMALSDCRTCSDPCDEGHDSYPNRFDIDNDSQMLGSVKPYRRQIVISTGKSDWDREITDTKGSLAAYLQEAQYKNHTPATKPSSSPPPHVNGKSSRSVTGLFRSTDSTRVSILNGSHFTISDNDDLDTVLVFPDYTVVADVSRTREGAQGLWESTVDPEVGRGCAILEKSPFKTWVLPYSCVIFLCSHKRRDNRCAIAAPKLEHAFIHSLERHGWSAETQVECTCFLGPPLEDLQGTEATEQSIAKKLKDSSVAKRVLILRTSHIGGHKFAGNCVIYTPQGSCVWYGRVSPHEVESIVVNTVMNGLVLPPLLRAGLNISRPGCKSLNDW